MGKNNLFRYVLSFKLVSKEKLYTGGGFSNMEFWRKWFRFRGLWVQVQSWEQMVQCRCGCSEEGRGHVWSWMGSAGYRKILQVKIRLTNLTLAHHFLSLGIQSMVWKVGEFLNGSTGIRREKRIKFNFIYNNKNLLLVNFGFCETFHFIWLAIVQGSKVKDNNFGPCSPWYVNLYIPLNNDIQTNCLAISHKHNILGGLTSFSKLGEFWQY